MDAKTIEAMSALWVDITPDAPVEVPSPEDAAKAAEELKAKEAEKAEKDWVEIKTDKPNDDKITDDNENNVDDNKEVIVDEGKQIELEQPKDQEPEILNDNNPDQNKKIDEDDPNKDEDVAPEEDLDAILKTLESMTEESLDWWDESNEASKIRDEIREKTELAKKQEWDPKKQSKTIQEIVDLNVKLQNELAIKTTANKAKDKKLAEVQAELSSLKMDDSRMVVPSELQSVNRYLTKYKDTSNETFKIKAIQEAVDLIEDLTWKPLRWNYLDDYIEEDLKKIESVAKKTASEISNKQREDEDPRLKFAKTYGVEI